MKKSTEPCQKLHPPLPSFFTSAPPSPLPEIPYQADSDNEAVPRAKLFSDNQGGHSEIMASFKKYVHRFIMHLQRLNEC